VRRVELYDDPKLYDVLRPRVESWDGPFYRQLAERSAGKVLELACGNGLLSRYLADGEGIALTGLDMAPAMLDDARSRVPEARFVEGDIRAYELGERFDLIVLALNSLLHLHTREDLQRALRCARQHLDDDGRFALDIFQPQPGFLARDPEGRFPVATREDPATGRTVVVTEATRYDRATQLQTTTWYYAFEGEEETVAHEIVVRVIFPEELLLLLEVAGLEVCERYGDFRKWPFDARSDHQVIVARRV